MSTSIFICVLVVTSKKRSKAVRLIKCSVAHLCDDCVTNLVTHRAGLGRV